MNRIRKSLTAAFVSATMFLAATARAMPIWQFDKMADEDQDEYIADLIVGAQKVLKDDRHPDLADQVHKLFNTRHGDEGVSLGMIEFERNLARARH